MFWRARLRGRGGLGGLGAHGRLLDVGRHLGLLRLRASILLFLASARVPVWEEAPPTLSFALPLWQTHERCGMPRQTLQTPQWVQISLYGSITMLY